MAMSLRAQSVLVGRAWWREWEAAGHGSSAVGREMERRMLVLGSVPFTQPRFWLLAWCCPLRMPWLPLLSYISPRAPPETCQEVRLLRVCKSSHADREDGHHTLRLCRDDSSKSPPFWSHLGRSACNSHRRASWARYAWRSLLSCFPSVTEHVRCCNLWVRLPFFALTVLLMAPGPLAC